MAEIVTISSFTGNTPVSIYYCDSLSANCSYVGATSNFPYTFTVPSPIADSNFLVKIVDYYSCEIGEIVSINSVNAHINFKTASWEYPVCLIKDYLIEKENLENSYYEIY
jgi:hypothetical protein